MKDLIWRIFLIIIFILIFGYLSYKYDNKITIDDDTLEIVTSQQVIDIYYNN